MTRRWILAGVAALLVAGCGPTQLQREFRQPTCDLNDSVGLMAQAVSTARFLPCIEEYPAGWTFDSSDTRRGQGRFWMDSDRAGLQALEVTVTRTCDTAGTEITSDEPGTRLFVRAGNVGSRYRGTRYYVFPGGCITYDFDFPQAGASVLSTDVSTAIGMFPRSVLLEAIRKLGLKA